MYRKARSRSSKRRRRGGYRRRRYTSRRRTRRLRVRGNSITATFPNVVRMRYVEASSVNPGAGSNATLIFRANSIHDPNFSGLGHQPFKHDIYQQLFNHYIVLGSKITYYFLGADPGTTSALACAYLNEDSTVSTTNTSLCEQGRCTYIILDGLNSSYSRKKLTCRYSAKKFFNVTNVKDNLDRFGAAFGANPPEEAYFVLQLSPFSALADIGTIDILVTVDYIVAVSEPKELVQA